MQETDGKREIEAVCDTWKGGLVGYLTWKIKQFLEEDTGIDFIDLQENTPDDLDITETREMDGIYDV
jgi:hypothetical protein